MGTALVVVLLTSLLLSVRAASASVFSKVTVSLNQKSEIKVSEFSVVETRICFRVTPKGYVEPAEKVSEPRPACSIGLWTQPGGNSLCIAVVTLRCYFQFSSVGLWRFVVVATQRWVCKLLWPLTPAWWRHILLWCYSIVWPRTDISFARHALCSCCRVALATWTELLDFTTSDLPAISFYYRIWLRCHFRGEFNVDFATQFPSFKLTQNKLV